ncbi:MAG: M48 family metallopeptidase [Ktedonobacterales bacterium]
MPYITVRSPQRSWRLAFSGDALPLPHAKHDERSQPAPVETPLVETPLRAELDAGRQVQARHYARQRQAFSLLNLLITAVVLAVLLFGGLSFALRDALGGVPGWQPFAGFAPARIAAYFLVLFAVSYVLELPIVYYSGHVLPRRYGISTQRLGAWVWDLTKGLVLSLVLDLLAVAFLYALLAAFPTWWWLWAGLAVLLVTALLANLAPVLLVPLFYKLTPLPEGEVREQALRLAARTGTRVRGIYSMNLSAKTTAANAMVIGLGNTRRIVVGDTLLDRYASDEIETVVAHELGHQVHHDIPKLIAFETLTTLGGLLVVNLVLHAVVARVPAYHGLADPATMPLLGAALGVFFLVLLPLTNGFSRRVEHAADVYALETTDKPAAFISAMTRLANQNLAEVEPSPLVEFLLYSHPAVGRRLAFARRYAASREGASRATPSAG